MTKESEHNYNQEMRIGINHLKAKRVQVTSQIEAETEVFNKLQDEIAILNERL